MADSTILNLPAAGPLTGAEVVPVVQGGVNVRTTQSALAAPVLVTHFGWQKSSLNANANAPVGDVMTDPRTVTNALDFTPEALAVPGGVHYVNSDYETGYANHPTQNGWGFVAKAIPLHRYTISSWGFANIGSINSGHQFQEWGINWTFAFEPDYTGAYLGLGAYTPIVSGQADQTTLNGTAVEGMIAVNQSIQLGRSITMVIPDTDPDGWWIDGIMYLPSLYNVNGDPVNSYLPLSGFEYTIVDHGLTPCTFPT